MPVVELKLKAASRGYSIHIGAGLLDQAGPLILRAGLTGKAVVICDTRVASLYSGRLAARLRSSGFDASVVEIRVGEEQKSLEAAAGLYDRLNDLHAERMTPIIALGGGVVGDLAGFVAATYMRGVPLVQIPTTILAQADSSIGGKVAVNHGGLKNRIGAFYHPRVTIADVTLLKTLNGREVSDGLAEVIKYGMILDADLFGYLEENMEKIRALDEVALEHVIEVSAVTKARIVEKDELDLGMRNILNYGHTIGHAVESVSKLKLWHGEAVAVGMLKEARLACSLGSLKTAEVDRLERLLTRAGLPTSAAEAGNEELLSAMQQDKKVSAGKIRFALPNSIGGVYLTTDVSESAIMEAIA